MKKIFGLFFIWILSLSIISFEVSAQDATLSAVQNAFKSGSYKSLVQYCAATVELTLDENKSSYSKEQAESMLKNFFSKYPASNFSFLHQGTSKEGRKYAIGKYAHSNGSFRIALFLKQSDGNYLIDSIDFSPED